MSSSTAYVSLCLTNSCLRFFTVAVPVPYSLVDVLQKPEYMVSLSFHSSSGARFGMASGRLGSPRTQGLGGVRAQKSRPRNI